MNFSGPASSRLLGVASACRGLGLDILGRCDKILMAVQPANSITIEQFVRPFYIAIMYQNFMTVAPGGPQRYRHLSEAKKFCRGRLETKGSAASPNNVTI